MRIELVAIGNSRGVRIPKPLIEQCGFGDTVDLRVENDCIIIAPDRPSPRAGWEQAFRAANTAEADELLIDDGLLNDFDRDEWRW
jgi:antitoxin MazE